MIVYYPVYRIDICLDTGFYDVCTHASPDIYPVVLHHPDCSLTEGISTFGHAFEAVILKMDFEPDRSFDSLECCVYWSVASGCFCKCSPFLNMLTVAVAMTLLPLLIWKLSSVDLFHC